MNGGERRHFNCVRKVWSFVSRHPQATVREISANADLAVSTVHAALVDLALAGYITQESGAGSGRTRQVLLPFITGFTIHERTGITVEEQQP